MSYFTPQEAQAIFNQANDAYAQGNLPAAKEGYRKLIEHGLGGPDVLFNLGTTHLAAGELGEAVLYLERARKDGRRDEDVMANLGLARSRLLDSVVGADPDGTFVKRLVDSTPANAVAGAFLACWVLAFVGLMARRFLRVRRMWLTLATVVFFFAAIPSGLLLAAHIYVQHQYIEGVVLAPSLPAREIPKQTGKITFEVHAGLKVRLLEDEGKFVRIRLPNGLEGWAERDGVAPL